MKSTYRRLLLIMFLISLGLTFGNVQAGTDKVTICHIPPGNPANAHSITVSDSALPAHLAHGDSVGDCGGGGSDSEGSPTGPTFAICDDREGETGRSVGISLVGRLTTSRAACD